MTQFILVLCNRVRCARGGAGSSKAGGHARGTVRPGPTRRRHPKRPTMPLLTSQKHRDDNNVTGVEMKRRYRQSDEPGAGFDVAVRRDHALGRAGTSAFSTVQGTQPGVCNSWQSCTASPLPKPKSQVLINCGVAGIDLHGVRALEIVPMAAEPGRHGAKPQRKPRPEEPPGMRQPSDTIGGFPASHAAHNSRKTMIYLIATCD